jgi:hypothetical protein
MQQLYPPLLKRHCPGGSQLQRHDRHSIVLQKLSLFLITCRPLSIPVLTPTDFNGTIHTICALNQHVQLDVWIACILAQPKYPALYDLRFHSNLTEHFCSWHDSVHLIMGGQHACVCLFAVHATLSVVAMHFLPSSAALCASLCPRARLHTSTCTVRLVGILLYTDALAE